MTTAEKNARAVVEAWCRKEKIRLTCRPCHVHPRAYVVGYAAPGCLIVARPWLDSEPQVRDFDRRSPLTVIHRFDPTLQAGDWCFTAYVCRAGCQENVAVSVPDKWRRTGKTE